jgi:protein SCO1
MIKSTDSNNKPLFILIGGLVGAIVLVAVYILVTRLNTTTTVTAIQTTAQPSNGVLVIEPSIEVGEFTLTNTNNQPVTQDFLQGKFTLVTFGFTHCPDFCPLNMNMFRQLREELGTDAPLQYAFVSVDGERDTPEAMLNMLERNRVQDFVLGITGLPDQVKSFSDPLGVVSIFGEPSADGVYMVDHTTSHFLFDSQGNWIRRYSYGMDRAFMIQDLRDLMDLN